MAQPRWSVGPAALLAGLLACLVPRPSLANDTLATLGAGGLQYVKADRIAMQREDLYISPQEIRVRYEMRNDRGEPFTGHVAFPLPVLPGALSRRPVQLPFPREPNFVRFRVRVDGQDITPALRVWAMVKGHNVTGTLREAGVEVAPRVPREVEASAYAPDALQRLVAQEIVSEPQDEYDGTTTHHRVYPLWDTYAAFEWDQTFKPGLTVVEHSYVPVSGGRWAFASGPGKPPDLAEHRGKYCIDRGAEAAIRSAALSVRRPADQAPGTVRTLSYVLTTAANWSGPIGTFHLMLDTGGPGNVVSLCLPGLSVARTGPTRFEATARNWTPRRDLDVLFYPPRGEILDEPDQP